MRSSTQHGYKHRPDASPTRSRRGSLPTDESDRSQGARFPRSAGLSAQDRRWPRWIVAMVRGSNPAVARSRGRGAGESCQFGEDDRSGEPDLGQGVVDRCERRKVLGVGEPLDLQQARDEAQPIATAEQHRGGDDQRPALLMGGQCAEQHSGADGS